MRKTGAQQILRQYLPEVAQLFGVRNPGQISIQVGNLPPKLAAEASFQEGIITLDQDFLESASRPDIRGAIIHEATHAIGVGHGKPDKRVEDLADYARYVLNPKDRPDWEPSEGVLRIAERRDDMLKPQTGGSGTRNNGPRTGRGYDGRRARNTFTNAQSKTPVAPLLSPGQTAGYAQQLAALQSQYTTQRSGIKAQGGAVNAEVKSAYADIRANQIASMAEAESAAIANGVVGSSADLGARAGVDIAAGASRADAKAARNNAMMQLRLAQMQAQTDYQSGIAGVAIDKATAQAELANQQFMQDQFDALAQNYQAIYQSILQRLLGKGKRVAGTDPTAPLWSTAGGRSEPGAMYGVAGGRQ